jgi:hypothetical protein
MPSALEVIFLESKRQIELGVATLRFKRGCHARRYIIGNVNERSLADLWQGPEYAEFRAQVQAFDFAPCCGVFARRAGLIASQRWLLYHINRKRLRVGLLS